MAGWIYNSSASPPRMQVDTNRQSSLIYDIKYISSTTKTWNASKTYQFETNVFNVYATHGSFSVSPYWGDRLEYTPAIGTTVSGDVNANVVSLYHYSSPSSNVASTRYVTFEANGTFSNYTQNRGIRNFNINELDFKFQGYSYCKLQGSELVVPSTQNSLGWYYDIGTDTYFWYDRNYGTPSNKVQANKHGLQPVGGGFNGKIADCGYRLNNYMARFIPYSLFNLRFNYRNPTNFPIKVFLSPNLPTSVPSTISELKSGTLNIPSSATLIATLAQSASASVYSTSHVFYGLRGNQYLYFVGSYVGLSSSTATYSNVYISDISIDGGYHPGNNRQYLTTNTSNYYSPTQIIPIGITGATYATLVGTGNTVNATSSLSVSEIKAKIGNGTFKAGIWENGVWNNGWRVDEYMYEFYNVEQFFGYNRLKRWRVQISGPTASVSQFTTGDNISIGNIVAIDINEDRKVIKGYFTIINKTDTSIIVVFDNYFPLRRVERDSDNHRIYITKNVWLSGAFFNGYFKGIWNYGLFKGYPLITEMYDSHWIDGNFEGGHFSASSYSIPNFTDTVYSSGKVGLTFSSPHGLAVNDIITIDKNNKTVNPEYDGETTVTQVVNLYQIVIDKDWGADTTNESGQVIIDLSKGLIQKVNLKTNNRSKITTSISLESESIFLYDSWMDLNYYDTSAVNIGKPQNLLNSLSKKTYSENNLYGYPTKDILESTSSFRDSFSTSVRKYRLGTKYKVYADFIGDAGQFQDYFGPTGPDAQLFLNKGWTYSEEFKGSITFSRTEDLGLEGLTGQELKITTFNKGGILDIVPDTVEEILNRTNEQIERNRYTKIEFDLITYSNVISDSANGNVSILIGSVGPYQLTTPNSFLYSDRSTFALKYVEGFNSSDYLTLFNAGFYGLPAIHFNNVNKIKRDVYYSIGGGITASTLIDASFLPIYKNVDHILTSPKKKVEYFFNKRNLSMRFYGGTLFSPNLPHSSTVEYVLDNLHFYEVDMIPFFQYFTDENINKGVQVPYQGISPFIDYSNANFSFIDNISIGLDSIQTQNTFSTLSGVGVGIGCFVGGSI